MCGASEPLSRLRSAGWLLLLRNLVLALLLANAWLHFREDLSPAFLGGALVFAALLAAGMEAAGLRLLPAAAGGALVAALVRVAAFLLFRALEADLYYFAFDRQFFPALAPFLWVWLANFLALRHPVFLPAEVGLNGLALLAVFWSEARYRLRLYPHPSLFAGVLLLFIFLELAVLALAPVPDARAGRWEPERRLRRFLSFAWLLAPLLLVLLLFLLGRYNAGAVQAGGGLMKPTLLRFDFSPFVRLESEIELSDELVLLFRREGVADRLLLRRLVLSRFDAGGSFQPAGRSDLGEPPVDLPEAPRELADPGYRAREEVRQEYFLVNFDPSSLIGMDHPVRVAPLANWASSSFLRIYRVDSRVSRATAAELERAGVDGLPPAARRLYTDYGGDPLVRQLAERVAGTCRTPFARVRALQEYLQKNYCYSLVPGPAEDGNQLHHFLFRSRKGYCSYFAFAMTLLCRSLGIPARVAVGFFVDPGREVLNFYEVRADQAHAWTEVYLGPYGWIDVDASSTRLAPGEEAPARLAFDRDRFSRLIEEILDHQGQLAEQAPRPPDLAARLSAWGTGLLRALRAAARRSAAFLPLLAAGLLGARRLLPRLRSALARDPRRRIRLLFRCSLALPGGTGLPRRPRESLWEYGERLEREHGLRMLPWCAAYLEAAFGERFGPPQAAAAGEAYRRFLGSFRDRLPWWRRTLGVLNPLGGAGRPAR
jgi:transglutaminase-like putative cysteine protease